MKKVVMFLFCSMLTACSAPKSYMMQPEFGESISKVKRIGVTVPDATIKELAFGGATTVDLDASKEAKKVMEQAVIEGLMKNGLEARLIEGGDDLVTFQKGYRPLANELRNHFPGALGTPSLPSRIDGFKTVLQHNNIECVLAVEGLEHVSSAGRKAAQFATAILLGNVSKGMTYMHYNLFCGDDGKPMFTDSRVGTNFSISDSGDVAEIAEDITERMLKVAKAKD